MFQMHDKLQVLFTVDIQVSDNIVRGSCQLFMSLFPASRYRLQGVILHAHVRGSTQSGPAISSSHTPELPIWCDYRRSNPPLPIRDKNLLVCQPPLQRNRDANRRACRPYAARPHCRRRP